MQLRLIPCILIVCLALAGVALAQPPEVKRVLRTFDFEERRLGNKEDLPMHWAKVEGPGRPHYVNGRLVSDAARSGGHSFRFDLNGGGPGDRDWAGRVPGAAGGPFR